MCLNGSVMITIMTSAGEEWVRLKPGEATLSPGRSATVPVRRPAAARDAGRTRWFIRSCCGWFLVAALLRTQPRSNRKASLRSRPGKGRAVACDLLDTLVTGKKFAALFHLFSLVLACTHLFSHKMNFYISQPAIRNMNMAGTPLMNPLRLVTVVAIILSDEHS
jgi:hypothetical protein